MFISFCLFVLFFFFFFFFFFNDTATTEIYTLSLHDALPIYLHIGNRGGRHAGPDSSCQESRARPGSRGEGSWARSVGGGTAAQSVAGRKEPASGERRTLRLCHSRTSGRAGRAGRRLGDAADCAHLSRLRTGASRAAVPEAVAA